LKIAVTGGSGQLGSVVLRALAAQRSVKEIVSIDMRPPAVVSSRLRAVTADVRDPDFARHLEGCDVLVHLAFVVTEYLPRPVYDSINVGGSRNVFEAAVRAGVKQIVYSSSIAAYGVVPGHPVPIVESTPRRHQSDFPYSAAKFEVEAFLDELEPAHPGVAVVRLRPAIFLGTRVEHRLGQSLKRRTLVGLGKAPMPLVWDEDVADAVWLAIQRQARGAFNVTADDPKTAEEMAKATGMRVVRPPRALLRGLARLTPLLARAGIGTATDPAWIDAGGPTMIVSSERARRELGWKPRCPTCIDVMKRFLDTAPSRLDRRIAVFLRMVKLASLRPDDMPFEARRLRTRMHLALTGTNGGDVGLVLEDGHLTVSHGIPRPPSVVVTMKAATFVDLLAGRLDFATAQFTGKIRVEGEALSAMLIQGMIQRFRGEAAKPGAGGFMARKLSQWIARGATA
jgi:UDP-glucose 4-epimerase